MKTKLLKSAAGGLALLLLSAPLALAQSTTPTAPPAPTGGTTKLPGAGATGKKTATSPNLDLPFQRPSSEPTVTETPEPPPEPEPPEEPPTFGGEPIPSENSTIYYVIDASGSMSWDSRTYVDAEGRTRRGNRMDRAKAELAKSITALPKSFKFNIIAYACSVLRWSRDLQEANNSNKASALSFVNRLFPNGGTMTGPATALALTTKENKSVVLLTDGEPNCGGNTDDDHLRVIKGNNTQGAVITVFGIGATGSLRRFCQDVARQNGGNYVDVP